MVKVVTINILFELDKWEQRRQLLVDGLAAFQADLIALQEVKLPEDTGTWLAQQLEMPYVHLVPQQEPGKHNVLHGIAILSRQLDYIFINQHWRVKDCQLILNQPSPDNRYLYPSDHFGLAADLEMRQP